MSRVKNRGVSMVEILISIAIFAILMIPIVSGIISAMHNTTQAKTLQYRNEYAENLMEYVKEESLVNILEGNYLSSIGTYDNSVSIDFYKKASAPTYDSSLKPIADLAAKHSWTPNIHNSDVEYDDGMDIEDYPYEVYTLAGKVNLGTEHTTYSYKMQISNKYYAEKEAGTSYVNPNNLALGIVEDIDHTKVALINGTIANYDTAVSNAFMTKKLEVLREKYPDWYEIFINQSNDAVLFPDDTATRVITIKVSGKETAGYQVTCGLSYRDNGEYSGRSYPELMPVLNNYSIDYVPFEYNYPVDSETGKAELPNIYLMYNVCLYNGRFSKDDYIVFDTSGVEDDTEIKCFVVQTAESYSENLRKANDTLLKKKTDDSGNVLKDAAGNDIYEEKILYNNATTTVSSRNDVKIHMLATTGSQSKLKNLSIYHNFDIGVANTDKNKKNADVVYKQGDGELFGTLAASQYIPLISYSGGAIDVNNSVKEVNTLDSAKEENRGLYEVSLWIVEGDDIDAVDTSVSPVMTGTKGGDES